MRFKYFREAKASLLQSTYANAWWEVGNGNSLELLLQHCD